MSLVYLINLFKMAQSNLSNLIFPDPEKRGVVMEPVCGDLEIHIWRLLLDLLASGEELELYNTRAIGFQDHQKRENQTFRLYNSHFKNQRVALSGETPGIITYDFPEAGSYIMRAILGGTKRLNRTSMLRSLQKRNIPEATQKVLIPEIKKTDDMWFANLFLIMLTKVGVNLSIKEREQLIANINWFRLNY